MAGGGRGVRRLCPRMGPAWFGPVSNSVARLLRTAPLPVTWGTMDILPEQSPAR